MSKLAAAIRVINAMIGKVIYKPEFVGNTWKIELLEITPDNINYIANLLDDNQAFEKCVDAEAYIKARKIENKKVCCYDCKFCKRDKNANGNIIFYCDYAVRHHIGDGHIVKKSSVECDWYAEGEYEPWDPYNKI